MVTYSEDGATLRCAFTGNIDTTFCTGQGPEIRKKLTGVDGNVVFDLTDVVAVCSMFLGMCVLIHKELGDRFCVENCSDDVYAIFRVSKLDKIIRVS